MHVNVYIYFLKNSFNSNIKFSNRCSLVWFRVYIIKFVIPKTVRLLTLAQDRLCKSEVMTGNLV